jgi:hypothetical protein
MTMSLTRQIAKHFREVHFGGNWTWSNLKDTVADVTWQQATTKVYDLNTIATLVYHIHYFVAAVLPVFQGGILDAHDKYSFNHPPINSREDWENLVDKALTDAGQLAALIELMPEHQLWEIFSEEKYGNYYRNIHGIIEHTHYHLGQIAVIKKIIRQTEHPIGN